MKYLLVVALSIVAASASYVLTNEQATSIKTSWDQVKNNEVDILYFIFKSYPDIQAKFPQFAGKDLEELKGTAEFATHAGRIVGFMSKVIGFAGGDSRDPVIALAKELAGTHKPRGVTKDQFIEFRTAFMSYLKTYVTMDESTKEAWTLALDSTFGMLFVEMGF